MSNSVGERIKKRRNELGWSQTRLGKAYGVSQPTIVGYEKGEREIAATDLPRFARILGVSVSYFFEEDSQYEADPDADGNIPRLVAYYDDLPPDSQDDLLAMAHALWLRNRKEERVIGRRVENDEETKTTTEE